jgi:hypothetical protein
MTTAHRHLILFLALSGASPLFGSTATPVADAAPAVSTTASTADSTVASTVASTAPVRAAPPQNPFSLRFTRDQSQSRAELGYNIRWDSRDVRRLPATLNTWRLHPVRTLTGTARDIVSGARLEFYGVRFRAPILPEDPDDAPTDALSLGPSVVASSKARQRFMRDLRRNLDRQVRRAAIVQSFDLALPGAKEASYSDKKLITGELWKAGETWGFLPDLTPAAAQTSTAPATAPWKPER